MQRQSRTDFRDPNEILHLRCQPQTYPHSASTAPGSPPASSGSAPTPRRRALAASTGRCSSRRSGWSVCSLIVLSGATAGRRPGLAALLRDPPGRSSPRVGIVLMVGVSARRLHPAARLPHADLRVPDRLERAGAAVRRRHARVAPLVQHRLLPVPALRARQGAADRDARGVRRGPRARSQRRRTTLPGARHSGAAGRHSCSSSRTSAPRSSTARSR